MFTQLASVGAALGTGGTNPALDASALSGITSILDPGAARDQSRQARVNWTLNAAKQGSVLAAEIIIAAPQYVANDEAPMWEEASSQIPQPIVQLAYSVAPNGWWPDKQPDFYTDVNGPTHQTIVAQVQAAANAAGVLPNTQLPVVSNATTSTAQRPAVMLPTMVSTAPRTPPTNYTPIVIALVVLLVGALGYFTLSRR